VPYLLFFAFVVVPLLELWVIIQVGSVIGAGWTIALLILDSLVGAWLVKREGLRAWRRLTSTFEQGRSPVDELTQGALVVFGGALLLTPGFVTDVLGLACVLPFTRVVMSSFVRRVAATVAARRMGAGSMSSAGVFISTGGRGSSSDRASDGPRRPVRPSSGQGAGDGPPPDVEVLEVERNGPED
jgi:UPF0716 protein FxsA